jgi:predicted RNase H-like nuclease (RuvC/YqgF family)
MLTSAAGQDPGSDARSTREDVDAAVRTDQAAQEGVEAWAAERSALQARYRQLENDLGFLERRVARERTTTEALAAKVAEYERRLVESERLTESLEDTLSVLVERLADAVADDLPFLPAERRNRLELLERELGSPDTPAAEKLRRVLEAYQVEAGYGGTVEIDTATLTIQGEEVRADVLRVGRLALFWATPDRSRVGVWDPAAGEWTELGGGESRAVLRAMDMAARLRPVEVIGLPVGRIAP